jgi:epoxyqueuosine reductase QueG
VAHIAGLGTVGINNMLITDSGCCGRLGSIVTSCELEYPSTEQLEEKCLFKMDGSCGICRERCIVGAYGDGDFNRALCYETCLENAGYHEDIGLADVCGKCCVGLPCSIVDPTRKKGHKTGT